MRPSVKSVQSAAHSDFLEHLFHADREVAVALFVFPGAGDRTLVKLAIDHVMISRAGSPSGVGFKMYDSSFLVEGSLRDRCRIRVCIEGTGHSFPVIL